MKIELTGESFLDWLYDLLKSECVNKLNEYKNLIPPDVPNVDIIPIDASDKFISDIESINGTIDERLDYFKKLNSCSLTYMQAGFEGHKNDDNMFILDTLTIRINLNDVTFGVVEKMCEFEHFIDTLKMCCHHEVGHILDFISYHNKPYDEFVNKLRCDKEERIEFYNNGYEDDEYDMEYDKIDFERTANLYGGVDSLKINEVNKIIRDKIKNNKTTIVEINTTVKN